MLSRCWRILPSNRKIVLLYHSIGDSPWGLSERSFIDQLEWLYEHCTVLPLSSLIHASSSDKIQVAITFDDGYASLYHTVAKKLADKNLNATVYINTGWMGENETYRKRSNANLGHYPNEHFLIWQEVEALKRAGWEIGSHGVNHFNFSKLDLDVMREELSSSKAHIEDYLKIKCAHLAYPWGRYSKNVKDVACQLGYQYAAAGYHAPLRPSVDLFALPRMNISTEYSFDDFKNVVRGQWDYLGLIHKIRGL